MHKQRAHFFYIHTQTHAHILSSACPLHSHTHTHIYTRRDLENNERSERSFLLPSPALSFLIPHLSLYAICICNCMQHHSITIQLGGCLSFCHIFGAWESQSKWNQRLLSTRSFTRSAFIILFCCVGVIPAPASSCLFTHHQNTHTELEPCKMVLLWKNDIFCNLASSSFPQFI